jgi:hypothetical protein
MRRIFFRIQFQCKLFILLVLAILPNGVAATHAEPVAPFYSKLKSFCILTDIVRDGRPAAAIIVPSSIEYTELAEQIKRKVKQKTGVDLSIYSDDTPEAAVPITRNLIVLGNRSTNKTIGELYNRFFTLLDLRYPGIGGSVVRTVHNPFGNGFNVVLTGGSNLEGVASAVDVFIRELDKAQVSKGSLEIDRIARISLGSGIVIAEIDG